MVMKSAATVVEMAMVVWHNARGERVQSDAMSRGEAETLTAKLRAEGKGARVAKACVLGK